MTLHTFSLEVPSEARFSSLATDVAAKFLELMGGTAEDAAAFGTAVGSGIASLACAEGATVSLKFHAASTGLDVTLGCAGRSTVVKHPLPVKHG